ncbi:MAG: GYD domain-containing protein [Thermoplasmata archaeon]
MLLVTYMSAIAGKYTEAIRAFKNPKIPKGIKIIEFLGTFGEYDAVIVFEAQDEENAAEFIVQFGEVATPKTLVAFPVEKFKWTK